MVARFGPIPLGVGPISGPCAGCDARTFCGKDLFKDLILQEKTRASHPALGPETGPTPSGIGPTLATIYPP